MNVPYPGLTVSCQVNGEAANFYDKNHKIRPGTGYEQRFYLHEGKLLEEYTEPEAENRPDVALEIGDTEVFEPSLTDDGLLEIRTDEGTSYVNTQRH